MTCLDCPVCRPPVGLPAVPEEKRPDGETWLCGTFQPAAPPLKPYRCTDPAGHIGDHVAEIDGEIFAFWSAGESKENN